MGRIANKIVGLLTDKKHKVPLAIIYFNYPKYVEYGADGSCICSVHPDLAQDDILKDLLNQVVDHIRGNYDMKKLTDL